MMFTASTPTDAMPVNTVFSWFIRKRLHQIELFRKYPKEVQDEVFRDHIAALSQTRFGREHGVTPQMDRARGDAPDGSGRIQAKRARARLQWSQTVARSSAEWGA